MENTGFKEKKKKIANKLSIIIEIRISAFSARIPYSYTVIPLSRQHSSFCYTEAFDSGEGES